jgi:hypothetical protein
MLRSVYLKQVTDVSVTDYQSTLRNIQEEQIPHLHRRGSQKARNWL